MFPYNLWYQLFNHITGRYKILTFLILNATNIFTIVLGGVMVIMLATGPKVCRLKPGRK
jgi:hypothetical protein